MAHPGRVLFKVRGGTQLFSHRFMSEADEISAKLGRLIRQVQYLQEAVAKMRQDGGRLEEIRARMASLEGLCDVQPGAHLFRNLRPELRVYSPVESVDTQTG